MTDFDQERNKEGPDAGGAEAFVPEGVQRFAEWILSKPRPDEYFSKAEQGLKALRIVCTSNSALGQCLASAVLSSDPAKGQELDGFDD
jgi:hypothetical protein